MIKFVWCYGLFIFQVVLIHVSFSAFTSELDNDLAQINEALPLETAVPWEFNFTLSASNIMAVNASVQRNITFCLVEVHSYLHNASIIYDNGEAYGTDVGVIIFPHNGYLDFFINNPNKVALKVLGYITAYTDKAPIPGAFVSSNETLKPLLMMDVSKNLIKLSAVPALNIIGEKADSYNSTSYRLYYMYTKEKDFSVNSYFDGIRTMIYEDQMEDEAYEYKLPLTVDNTTGRIHVVFAKYPGTGLFFKLEAYGLNGTSTYVIGHTFGCDYLSNRDSCVHLVNTFHRVEVIILCVAGLILCFCGYEWKGFELGILTLLLVSIFIYASFYNMLTVEANIITSSVAGLIGSSLTVVFVLCFKCVHIRHIIAFAVFGMLTSSALLFYVGVGNSAAFRNEDIFWATFSAISISVFLLLYLNCNLSHYLTSSVIGSFMVVLTIDYFAGSSLKYLIFDNIRRASVENFFGAYVSPPFQTPDVVLSVLWFALTISSLAFQCISHAITCEDSTAETQSELEPDDVFEQPESVKDQSDGQYSTFDDNLALIDPDPYRRWLVPGRKSF